MNFQQQIAHHMAEMQYALDGHYSATKNGSRETAERNLAEAARHAAILGALLAMQATMKP